MDGVTVRVLHERCGALEVDKRSVRACVLVSPPHEAEQPILRSFGTVTREISELMAWLEQHRVTHLAVSAKGTGWKPIWNMLEGRFELLLTDDQNLQPIPGQGGSLPACQWLADLLRHGLLRNISVPPADARRRAQLDDYRLHLLHERQWISVAIRNALDEANIRLISVATDILGSSGQAILRAVLEGENSSERLAALAKGRLRGKIPELTLAVEGRLNEHQRFLLCEWLDLWTFLEQKIKRTDEQLARASGSPARSTRRRSASHPLRESHD